MTAARTGRPGTVPQVPSNDDVRTRIAEMLAHAVPGWPAVILLETAADNATTLRRQLERADLTVLGDRGSLTGDWDSRALYVSGPGGQWLSFLGALRQRPEAEANWTAHPANDPSVVVSGRLGTARATRDDQQRIVWDLIVHPDLYLRGTHGELQRAGRATLTRIRRIVATLDGAAYTDLASTHENMVSSLPVALPDTATAQRALARCPAVRTLEIAESVSPLVATGPLVSQPS